MTKKVVKKKTSKKSINKKNNNTSREKDRKFEKILVENFVSLQKVMVNLSIKFEDLTKQISDLLELFEDSAKALVRKDFILEKRDNKEVFEKLNSIMSQNKLIAKGLTLMHETATNPDTSYSLAPMPRESLQQKIIESPREPIVRRPLQRLPTPEPPANMKQSITPPKPEAPTSPNPVNIEPKLEELDAEKVKFNVPEEPTKAPSAS